MSDLVSKISASGLSAGVFLVWWPAHVTSQGSAALLARGVLWAAAFEVLLIALRPLERAVAAAVRDRRPAGLAPRRIGPVLALAIVATAVPAVLLSGTRGVVAPARAAAPKVIVKREIVRRVVVVRRVNRVVRVTAPAAATPATATTSAPAVAVRRPATAPAKRTATRPAPSKAASPPAADAKSDLPSSSGTTTTSEPAATASAPQPSTAAPAAAAGPASAVAASGR